MQTHIHHVLGSNSTSFSDLQRTPPSLPSTLKAESAGALSHLWNMKNITLENAVVVVSQKGCCMSYVVTRLLSSLGVNPHVVEVDMEPQFVDTNDGSSTPAVFIGGRLLGGVDTLLAAHITGSLVPQLKAAGALWL